MRAKLNYLKFYQANLHAFTDSISLITNRCNIWTNSSTLPMQIKRWSILKFFSLKWTLNYSLWIFLFVFCPSLQNSLCNLTKFVHHLICCYVSSVLSSLSAFHFKLIAELIRLARRWKCCPSSTLWCPVTSSAYAGSNITCNNLNCFLAVEYICKGGFTLAVFLLFMSGHSRGNPRQPWVASVYTRIPLSGQCSTTYSDSLRLSCCKEMYLNLN